MKRLSFVLAMFFLVANVYSQQVTIKDDLFYKRDGEWVKVKDGREYRVLHSILKVKFKSADFARDNQELCKSLSSRVKHVSNDGWYYLVFDHEVDAVNIASALINNPLIEDVEVDFAVPMDGPPNDSLYATDDPQWIVPGQWNLGFTHQDSIGIDADRAWDHLNQDVGDPNVIIAVIDAGFKTDHPDFSGNLWSHPSGVPGYNFYGSDSSALGGLGSAHGTPVAGMIAARTNNSIGIAAVASGWYPDVGCKLMLLRAGYGSYDPNKGKTAGYLDPWAAQVAFDSALAWGADVINFSIGPIMTGNQVLEAHSQNVVMTYSAGNGGGADSTGRYPWNYGAMCVGWTYRIRHSEQQQYQRSYEIRLDLTSYPNYGQSGWGDRMHVMAPGHGIWTLADPAVPQDPDYIYSADGKYAWILGGSSFSAPTVAGLAGLVKSCFPNLTADQIIEVICRSAERIQGYPGHYGYTYTNWVEQVFDYNDTNTDNNRYGSWDKLMGYGRVNAFYAIAPPDAPTSLYISGGQDDHPQLHWTRPDAPDTKYFQIKRTIDGNNAYFMVSGTATSWTDNQIYIDTDPRSELVTYRVRARDYTNQYSPYSNSASTRTNAIPMSGGSGPEISLNPSSLPKMFTLEPASPNPFNASTTLRFGLPEAGQVRLDVFDINGRHVTTLLNGTRPAGWSVVTWDAQNVASGTYFLLARMGGEVLNRKLTVIK